VRRPRAGDRPLLITEFGADTVQADEAGQARPLRQSWDGLRRAGAVGGVVFEFADEWWKNYDNPRRPGDWWDRQPAQDDELREDEDPEEHYGLVTADRRPKPAFAAVKEMFAVESASDGSPAPAAAVALVAGGLWAWARWGGRTPTPVPRAGEAPPLVGSAAASRNRRGRRSNTGGAAARPGRREWDGG